MMKTIVLCGAAVLAGYAPGQQPASRDSTDVVVVDARVVDRNGRVVADLTADDFEVRVDGSPRRIASLRYEAGALVESASTVLVAVDRPNLRMETSRGTLDAAAAFVEALPSSHAVGVVVLPEDKLRVAIGQPRAQVTRALRGLLGTYNPRMPMGEDELSARSAIHRVLSVMSTVKGRRTVVWLADRMYDGASTVDTARRAALQGVAFYVLAADAPMMTAEDGVADGLAGLTGLAAASGGAFLRRSAGATAVFGRLALELSGQYVLAFETETGDAGLHNIRVRVKREGLDVRARREFVK
jgi:VWFA-related protein